MAKAASPPPSGNALSGIFVFTSQDALNDLGVYMSGNALSGIFVFTSTISTPVSPAVAASGNALSGIFVFTSGNGHIISLQFSCVW